MKKCHTDAPARPLWPWIVAICAGVLLCLCLTACGGKGDDGQNTDAPTAPEEQVTETSGDPQDPGTEPATEPAADTLPGTEDTLPPETEAVLEWSTRPRVLPAGWEDAVETDDREKRQVDLLDPALSGFDDLTTGQLSSEGWSTPYGGRNTVETDENGNNYLRYSGMSQNWHSPAFDLFPRITSEGNYTCTFRFRLEGTPRAGQSPCSIAVRGTRVNSFLADEAGNIYTNMITCDSTYGDGAWHTVSFSFSVTEKDLAEKDAWNLCFHIIDPGVSAICVDDVALYYFEVQDATVRIPTEAITWVATEMVLNSDVTRANAPFEAELDLVLTCGDTTLTVPGFWDGGKTWRVRFALPVTGEWSFRTVCSDTNDRGLHGLTGTILCTAYDGVLDIYKHGFVTVAEGNRYFTYADGTPFLYLGDTHWNLPTEEYDVPGDRAGQTGAESHFKYIVRQRVMQGFTVYQSEPIGAGFDLSDGISETDVLYFQNLDKYFAYIAACGLVHANAQFCFPSDMVAWSRLPDFEESLRVATRYWVARYGAYPVLWTLGQEVDRNFYGKFTVEDNPYVKVCTYIHALDAYAHPITGHQESTAYTKALNSAFRGVSGHTWYAVQWSPELNTQVKFGTPREYWENGEGKPLILYESLYDHLWTNHYGARVQGWLAFLNGMYGYGYGAEDIWLYKSAYDMDTTSNHHGILVTPEDKKVQWSESVTFESAYQVGYMLDFFSNLEWWKLEPRFDDEGWFTPKGKAFYSLATDHNDTYVLYLYNKSGRVGTLGHLDPEATYLMWWFDPQTGVLSEPTTFTAPDGTLTIESRPSEQDWTLLVKKAE